jgi:di/tricarboxylate transporter
VGTRAWAVPIVIFWLCAFLAAIGPGTVPVMTLMVPLAVVLAVEMKISPVMIAPITVLGSAGGGLTPIAPTGIIGLTLAAQQGFTGLEIPYALNSMTSEIFVAAIIYFLFGGHKLRSSKESMESLPAFNTNQKLTMAGVLFMAVAVLVLKVNVGLAGFIVGVILVILKAIDEKTAIKNMPWGTILLVCGVGVLMNLVIKLDGIKILSGALGSVMTDSTAVPILTFSSGIMSWFSSTSGVVMPTLIPTISGLLEAVPGTTPIELLSAITFGAHTAGISPASTGGALAMATYAATTGISLTDQNKLFMQMFLTAVLGVVLVSIFSATGAYLWFDSFLAAPVQ